MVDAARMLAAGAVLEDLDPAERHAYDTHRAGCPDCRSLEVDLDAVLADLALIVPERIPPPDLLAGIRRAISSDATDDGPAAVQRPAAVERPAGPPAVTSLAAERARRRPMIAALGLAAALAIVAIGLAVRSIGLSSELDRTTARLEALGTQVATQADVMAVAIDPKHVTTALGAEALAPDATAVALYVPGTTNAYLVAHDLPATPPGRTYQLWYADAAGVHPLGTETWAGSGTFVASFGMDLTGSAAVMVTLEPAGGSTGVPGPEVVFGELHAGA